MPRRRKPLPDDLTIEQLAQIVSTSCDLPYDKAHKVVRAILGSIIKAIHRGENVQIRGFGSFQIKHRKARDNRIMGVLVRSQARNYVWFEPARLTRYLLNPHYWGPKP